MALVERFTAAQIQLRVPPKMPIARPWSLYSMAKPRVSGRAVRTFVLPRANRLVFIHATIGRQRRTARLLTRSSQTGAPSF